MTISFHSQSERMICGRDTEKKQPVPQRNRLSSDNLFVPCCCSSVGRTFSSIDKSHQPFTAPEVTPSTMYLCRKRYRIRIGSMARISAAMIRPRSEEYVP